MKAAPWADRQTEIRAVLDDARARYENAERRAIDPVHFVHRYSEREDQEIVALLASGLAFGNVKAFSAKIEVALGLLGPAPARQLDDASSVKRAFAKFKHRFISGADLVAMLVGARRVQRKHGSLGSRLAVHMEAQGGDLLEALELFTGEIKELGGLSLRRTHGAKHILTRPKAKSANKRLMLLLRWMVRPADGVDLGLWSDIGPHRLVMPTDVHVHKLARNIGFTDRAAANWETAQEITRALRVLDASDPTRYDFALCHLGMVQRCPSKRDPLRCEGCGVKPICRHWAARPDRSSLPPKDRSATNWTPGR